MRPVGQVVAGPDGAIALRADERRSSENERSTLAIRAQQVAHVSGAHLTLAVDVVHGAMLVTVEVQGVLVKRDLGSVEHARLVHVVPRVRVESGARVVLQQELARPPLAHLFVQEVRPRRRALIAKICIFRQVKSICIFDECK